MKFVLTTKLLQKIGELTVFARGRRYSKTIDVYRCSKQLSEYMKTGRVEDAHELFEEMTEKNVVVWSIMVHGYSKNGLYGKALGCFSAMQRSGLVPNSFTFVGALGGVSGLEDIGLAQAVHGLILKSGCEFNSFVATALLDTYLRCRCTGDCYKVFDAIKSESVVPWNAMMSGLVHIEHFTDAFVLFNRCLESGFVPNSVTVMALTQGCIALDSHSLCESVHVVGVKFGLVSDTEVSNALLSMYSALTDLNAAVGIFDAMVDKDVISWSTMMSLLVQLERGSDAIKLFFRMRDFGISYDTGVLVNLISACGLLGNLRTAKSVHAQIVNSGFGLNVQLVNSIITMYARCGDLDSSATMFDKSTVKNVVSWTSMMSGFLLNKRPREALDIFIVGARKETNFLSDSILLVNTLIAAGELGLLDLCMQLHCHTSKGGFTNYRNVTNCLLSSYSKCGNVKLAHDVFTQMSSPRDTISWNAIIYGYGINGQGETALSLFREFRECGGAPDAATYLSVLSACARAEMVNDGLMIFSEMLEDDNIVLTEDHYGCLVDLLARAGHLSDARELTKNGDRNSWKAFMNGCALHGDTKLAEVAVTILQKQVQADPGQAVLLSNLYASVGRFHDAEALRSIVLVKDPGLSFL